MEAVNIFGFSCLFWALLLTVGCIKEKNKLFVKGKEHLGYGTIVGLYTAALLFITL